MGISPGNKIDSKEKQQLNIKQGMRRFSGLETTFGESQASEKIMPPQKVAEECNHTKSWPGSTKEWNKSIVPITIRAAAVDTLKNSFVKSPFEDMRKVAKMSAIMAPVASTAEWKGKWTHVNFEYCVEENATAATNMITVGNE